MIEFFIENSYLFSQIFGFMATLCLIFAFFQTKRTMFFIMQTTGNVFIVLSYFALGRYIVSLACIVATIRTTVFAIFAKKEKDVPWYVVLVIIIANVSACAITVAHVLDLLFVAGLIIYTLASTIKNLRVMRIILVFPTILYAAYALAFGNYTGLISTLFELTALIASIISDFVITKGVKNIKIKKEDRMEESSEL